MSTPSWFRTATLTLLALLAFAGNSLLCRLALGQSQIDAATFSTVRLISGAITLFLISATSRKPGAGKAGDWKSAFALFAYAAAFSFAYNSLSAGSGALILFGSVQITMMIYALVAGERPHPLQWLGLLSALGGLVYLVLPGVSAPSLLGSALMGLAGIAWGLYTLAGRGAADPLLQTTGNFIRSLPFIIVVSLLTQQSFHAEPIGLTLAIASGALTSGIGYVIWYAALGGLTAVRAAVVQLAVPILAAAGGIAFLGETLTMRLLLSTVVVLGGVGLALAGREKMSAK